MANSKLERQSRIILDLNEDEAMYLHALLQNCPYGTSPETEDVSNRESRSAIWCELNNCLEAM